MMKIEDLGVGRDQFGEKLIHFRREIMGWSQERLSREVGVTTRTVQRWEKGLSWPRGDSVIRTLVQLRFTA